MEFAALLANKHIDMEVTAAEMRATEHIYTRETGETRSYAQIPEVERDRIIRDIRIRLLAVEQHVTSEMQDKKLGQEQAGPNRQVTVIVVASIVMLLLLLSAVGMLRMIHVK